MEIRIGYGYDLHPMEEGRRCLIGGIDIPYERGPSGHSDADVLLHAITDALLGAVAMGDLGTHFPDQDPEWKGADSGVLMGRVWKMVADQGWQISNIDSTVVAEYPKLNPYITEIRASIADILKLESGLVSVKATTNERMGVVGRGEAIAAHAVVLLRSGS